MSELERNRQTRDTDPDLQQIDRMLADLAEDAPDMPADFHETWVKAVSLEAARNQPKKAFSSNGRAQWRRLAAAAAVMVFLVGGTLLTRKSFHPSVSVEKTEEKQAVYTVEDMAVPMASSNLTEPAAPMMEAVPDEADEALAFGMSAEEDQAMALGMAAEEDQAWDADEGDWMEAPMEEAAFVSDDLEEADWEETAEAAEPMEESEAMEEAEAEEESAYANSVTLLSEEPAEQPQNGKNAAVLYSKEAEASLPAEASEPEQPETQPEESEFVVFLRDLGTFTLRALPWMLGVLALWILWTVARKRRKSPPD